MEALDPALDLEEFFARTRAASERVLLLDYDGTIAPFHIDPRLALPYPGVCAVLRRVIAGTRVVIVSGRRLEDLRAPLALLPHTEVWASHGWEHVAAGRTERMLPSAETRRRLEEAAGAVRTLLREGLRLETKVASVAAHWRGLPPYVAEALAVAVEHAWKPLVGEELALLPFDAGLEIRARGRNKGDAVRDVLSTCGPEAVVAYLGDDLTDEDAFEAIRGRGLAVLVRGKHRSTRADLWLSRPHHLTAFLERWQPVAAEA